MNREELKGIIREVLVARLEGGAPQPEATARDLTVSSRGTETTDLVTDETVMAARSDGKVIEGQMIVRVSDRCVDTVPT